MSNKSYIKLLHRITLNTRNLRYIPIQVIYLPFAFFDMTQNYIRIVLTRKCEYESAKSLKHCYSPASFEYWCITVFIVWKVMPSAELPTEQTIFMQKEAFRLLFIWRFAEYFIFKQGLSFSCINLYGQIMLTQYTLRIYKGLHILFSTDALDVINFAKTSNSLLLSYIYFLPEINFTGHK